MLRAILDKRGRIHLLTSTPYVLFGETNPGVVRSTLTREDISWDKEKQTVEIRAVINSPYVDLSKLDMRRVHTQNLMDDLLEPFEKDVKLGDADKAIFWYRPKGAEKYRVIYGDLSVKDVAPENLPK